MRKIITTSLMATLGCSPETVELFNPDITVGYDINTARGSVVHVDAEGDVRGQWTQPAYMRDLLLCCQHGLGIDGPLHGTIVVTDNPDTYSAYFNFFRTLFDPADYAAAFSWAENRRGKQKLGHGDWTIVVNDSALGDTQVTTAVCHELLHATLSGDDAHMHTVWERVGDVATECE